MVNLDLQNRSRRTEGWSTVLDSLLVGITHNISNRIATLAGVSDILSGDPTIPPILRALADEMPRLEESVRLLRILAIPEDEHDEAVEATRLVSDAIALARLHPVCHGIRFEAGDGRAVPPVLARPTALTHEIVVALVTAAADVAAGESGSDHGGTPDREHAGTVELPVTFSSEGDDLVIAVGRHMVRARLLTAAAR